MFENIYPHKIPFIPQKDGKIFEDFKIKLRKYNIESINVYLSDSLVHINEEKNEEKVLYQKLYEIQTGSSSILLY